MCRDLILTGPLHYQFFLEGFYRDTTWREASGILLSPNPYADASTCCCKDKIEEDREVGDATRTKNIIVVMLVTNINLESDALFVVFVIIRPSNHTHRRPMP